MELDLGELGFWLFLAAVAVAFIIGGVMKHNAMLKLIQASVERSGTVDPKLAELLDKEFERKAQANAQAWGWPAPGAKSEAPRKLVSGMIGAVGGFLGFLSFVFVISRYAGEDAHPTLGGLVAGLALSIGLGACVAGAFGLVAWLIWPKSVKSSDSEPLV